MYDIKISMQKNVLLQKNSNFKIVKVMKSTSKTNLGITFWTIYIFDDKFWGSHDLASLYLNI